MQPPVTQDEKDKREATDNRIRYVGDLMSQMTDVEDKVVRLKIYKALIESSVNDPEAMAYLQQYIDKLEEEQKPKQEEANKQKSGVTDAEEAPDAFEKASEESEENLPSLESFNISEDKEAINEDSDERLPSPDELEDFPEE